MQLVVSGNRILAHGEDCFISMGGTVICTETGRVFQNATVVTDCENCPTDIGSVGYEYHAGVFVPCAPYGTDSGDGKIMVACDDCATPRKSEWTIKRLVGAAAWQLLAEYNTAGAYTFTVPDDVDELGVFILGGGAGGVADCAKQVSSGSIAIAAASGGSSGGLVQRVFKKSNGEFTNGQKISLVVGAGGTGGTATPFYTNGISDVTIVSPTDGGTSSFNGVSSENGARQVADKQLGYLNVVPKAPYGFDGYLESVYFGTNPGTRFVPLRPAGFGYHGRNIFDPNDTHVYGGAGGSVYGQYSNSGEYWLLQETVDRTKGHAGAGQKNSGQNATAPGDGGGGAGWLTILGLVSAVGGSGADGLVLVYGRKVV